MDLLLTEDVAGAGSGTAPFALAGKSTMERVLSDHFHNASSLSVSVHSLCGLHARVQHLFAPLQRSQTRWHPVLALYYWASLYQLHEPVHMVVT